jgi:hypothetical protein
VQKYFLSNHPAAYRALLRSFQPVFTKRRLATGLPGTALAFLLAGLALVSAGCSKPRTTGIFVDPAFGPLVPPDTTFMAGIRLDKLRETAFYKTLKGRVDVERRMNLFAERTGLDPQKDLWQILVVSNGADTLFLARGKFSSAGEMEPRLGELGKQRTSYKDYNLIGTPRTSVVFMNPGVAIAGTQTALKHLIDHRAEYKNLPAEFIGKLKAMPASDQAWVLSSGTLPGMKSISPDATGMRSMLSNLVGLISDLQAGFHVDEGVDMEANVDCISPEGAQRVRDTAKGLIGLARLKTPDDQMQLLKLYDTVEVEQKDARVTMQAKIAPELVDPFLQMLTEGRGRASQPNR